MMSRQRRVRRPPRYIMRAALMLYQSWSSVYAVTTIQSVTLLASGAAPRKRRTEMLRFAAVAEARLHAIVRFRQSAGESMRDAARARPEIRACLR